MRGGLQGQAVAAAERRQVQRLNRPIAVHTGCPCITLSPAASPPSGCLVYRLVWKRWGAA